MRAFKIQFQCVCDLFNMKMASQYEKTFKTQSRNLDYRAKVFKIVTKSLSLFCFLFSTILNIEVSQIQTSQRLSQKKIVVNTVVNTLLSLLRIFMRQTLSYTVTKFLVVLGVR